MYIVLLEGGYGYKGKTLDEAWQEAMDDQGDINPEMVTVFKSCQQIKVEIKVVETVVVKESNGRSR